MELEVQIVSNIVTLKSSAAQTTLTARIVMRLMHISMVNNSNWLMPIIHRSTNLKSMVMRKL